MASELPKRLVDVTASPQKDLSELFPARCSRVRIEIGFGGGEHLVVEAAREPDTGFIGVEPFINGMAKAVTAIVDGELDNVRLFGDDASLLLDWLPAASIDQIDLLYPDPWPKKRHWKRRFVSSENLDRLARVIKAGGFFCFASDIPAYVEWTLAHLTRDERFEWTAERADDWLKPFPNWPGTRYEAKALRSGRTPTYLAFCRV
jgi:tRNA (guanine-N7-)-methyltransferase